MQAGFKNYIVEAFNARPLGMPIPPNWIVIGAFGMLGFLNPGFWVLGAGVELGYLLMLIKNVRFRRFVNGQVQHRLHREGYVKLQESIDQLEDDQQARYRGLEDRCRRILKQLSLSDNPAAVSAQGEGLRRLLWIFLRLLLTRQAILRTLEESQGRGSKSLDLRIQELEDRLKAQELGENLRKSFQSQADILRQRKEKQNEARDKLVFIEAELVRI